MFPVNIRREISCHKRKEKGWINKTHGCKTTLHLQSRHSLALTVDELTEIRGLIAY